MNGEQRIIPVKSILKISAVAKFIKVNKMLC